MGKSLLNSIKDLQGAPTDFNSCIESGSSSNESPEVISKISTSSGKKSRKKRKKKSNLEMTRGDFIKRKDTKTIPK